MPNPFALLPSPCPPSPSACCIYSGSPLSSTACHGRPQPKTPLDYYIKDKQGDKEDFDKLSAADKKQYEEKALLSVQQYQKVLCFTLAAPPCTLSTSLMHPALQPRCRTLCASLYTLCLALHSPICTRGPCVPCVL